MGRVAAVEGAAEVLASDGAVDNAVIISPQVLGDAALDVVSDSIDEFYSNVIPNQYTVDGDVSWAAAQSPAETYLDIAQVRDYPAGAFTAAADVFAPNVLQIITIGDVQFLAAIAEATQAVVLNIPTTGADATLYVGTDSVLSTKQDIALAGDAAAVFTTAQEYPVIEATPEGTATADIAAAADTEAVSKQDIFVEGAVAGAFTSAADTTASVQIDVPEEFVVTVSDVQARFTSQSLTEAALHYLEDAVAEYRTYAESSSIFDRLGYVNEYEKEALPTTTYGLESKPAQFYTKEDSPTQTYTKEGKPLRSYSKEGKPSQTYVKEDKPF
jgi:hypothetical protein